MISTVLFHNRFLSLFMKGGERHSSLLTLRSSLNWWRREESNLPSAEFYLAVITMRPAPICLRFAGNVARHVPVFPGCHPRAFCAERNKHPLLNVVSCHHAAISKKFCPNWVAITMFFPNLGLAPMLMNHCLTWQTLTFSISATPSEVMSSFR